MNQDLDESIFDFLFFLLKRIISRMPMIITPMLIKIELLLLIPENKKDGNSFFEVTKYNTMMLLIEWASMQSGSDRFRTISQPRKSPRKKV